LPFAAFFTATPSTTVRIGCAGSNRPRPYFFRERLDFPPSISSSRFPFDLWVFFPLICRPSERLFSCGSSAFNPGDLVDSWIVPPLFFLSCPIPDLSLPRFGDGSLLFSLFSSPFRPFPSMSPMPGSLFHALLLLCSVHCFYPYSRSFFFLSDPEGLSLFSTKELTALPFSGRPISVLGVFAGSVGVITVGFMSFFGCLSQLLLGVPPCSSYRFVRGYVFKTPPPTSSFCRPGCELVCVFAYLSSQIFPYGLAPFAQHRRSFPPSPLG